LATALTCAAGAAGTGGSPAAPPEAGRASLGTVATVLSEDFESWPPAGWVLSADPQTGGVWKSLAHPAGCASGSSFPYINATGGAGLCADANSDCQGDGMDTTMVTPSFSLASPDYLSAQLQFKSDFFCAAALDEAWVDITTDGGAVWTNLLYFDHQSVRGPDTETIDLTPYLGQPDVRLSFEYAAPGWDWYWQVDDVAVTAVQQEPCTLTCTATVPASAVSGTPVSFATTAAPSAGCSGTPSFAWTFGDGQTSSEQNPTHAYASAGSYDWAVTASQDGAACFKGGTITIAIPPVVSFMKKAAPPFRIVVTGSNLQNRIKVDIDGAEWTSVVWKNTTKVVLKGALKSAIPKGVVKTFRFVNPDGGETVMTWSW
jgi:hypothetical protein